MSLKSIAAQQRMVALAHPCLVAEQCSARRYFFAAGIAPGIQAYVGLTVNVGEERTAFFQGRALWMVSMSINQTPLSAWPLSWRPMAERLARKVLEGAGLPTTDTFQWGRWLTLTLRRQCSDTERRRVVERYLSA